MMLIEIRPQSGRIQELTLVSGDGGERNRPPRINVLFTDMKGTEAALRCAATFAKNLDFDMRLIALEVVPYALPITHPPIPVSFRISQMLDLTQSTGTWPEVRLYLCRDSSSTLREYLEPNALLVIGQKKTWYPTRANRRAKALERMGFQIVTANF